MVLGAQGVFFNFFFLAALLGKLSRFPLFLLSSYSRTDLSGLLDWAAPRSAHRFVGYLEEEACYTYTHAIEALDRGELPEWEAGKQQVPTIAKDYWRLGDNATSEFFLRFSNLFSSEADHVALLNLSSARLPPRCKSR